MGDGTPVEHRAQSAGRAFAHERSGRSSRTHLGWAAKGLGVKIGEMLKASAKVAEVRKFLSRIYNQGGKPET